ncbi:hypothetical protein F4806DRAFT_305273 [Annulohypoxylon nitens]|nr:hypothetical protein F4806DRAFT_305273 [Annulohypoxylon nitens]
MIGADIFVTVGYNKKKESLMAEYDIPPENMFYSRDTSFAEDIMYATNGCGVDVVVNSLSGDGLQASFECMASYGRFIEIGKADIMANTSLPMAASRRNVSFSAVDVYHMCHSKDTINDVMRKVLDLTTNGFLTPPQVRLRPALSQILRLPL